MPITGKNIAGAGGLGAGLSVALALKEYLNSSKSHKKTREELLKTYLPLLLLGGGGLAASIYGNMHPGRL